MRTTSFCVVTEAFSDRLSSNLFFPRFCFRKRWIIINSVYFRCVMTNQRDWFCSLSLRVFEEKKFIGNQVDFSLKWVFNFSSDFAADVGFAICWQQSSLFTANVLEIFVHIKTIEPTKKRVSMCQPFDDCEILIQCFLCVDRMVLMIDRTDTTIGHIEWKICV